MAFQMRSDKKCGHESIQSYCGDTIGRNSNPPSSSHIIRSIFIIAY